MAEHGAPHAGSSWHEPAATGDDEFFMQKFIKNFLYMFLEVFLIFYAKVLNIFYFDEKVF